MRQEFCIYPQRCRQQCDILENLSKEMLSYKNRLENIKMTLAGLSGNGYSDVVSYLDSVIAGVETEKNDLEALEAVLSQSIQLYTQTEETIAGTNIALTKSVSEKGGLDDKLADILTFISDLRGSYLGIVLEALALRGILVDYAIGDIGKILNGTYLSSYWRDGRLYLNLNYDDLTNRQAIDWLEKNLGGHWDDYLARHMKRDGFAVFGKDGGFLRDMKYFDDITDKELLQYFSDIKQLDNVSFGTAFRENFNFFDDFNYKEYKNLGNLGKAGKIMGTAGTVLTIGGDAADNFYNPETGTWDFSGKQLTGFVFDVAVDMGAGAGSAAAGAAIGSFFAPPVGTVVGAGVGFAIDFAANNIRITDIDGDGENDSIIDIAKHLGHEAIDKGEDALDSVLDWGSDAISNTMDWFNEAFAF